jgi:hypothetical protein
MLWKCLFKRALYLPSHLKSPSEESGAMKPSKIGDLLDAWEIRVNSHRRKGRKPFSVATSTARQSYHATKVGIAHYRKSFVRF